MFGRNASSLKELVTLHGHSNVARPGQLAAHTNYAWQVIAVMTDGSTRAGPVWTFSTSACKSCSSCVDVTTPWTLRPTPPSCLAALNKCCGNNSAGTHGGNVQGKGDLCMHHMSRHNSSLVDPEAGCSLQDEQRFCDPCGVGFPFCDISCNGLSQRSGVAPQLPGCCRPGAANPRCCQQSPVPPNCCVPR